MLVLTHQGCSRTPGGRIRVPRESHGGFARVVARSRSHGQGAALCHRYGSRVNAMTDGFAQAVGGQSRFPGALPLGFGSMARSGS